MKVILVSKVANYGNIGDIVDVKNGFAKNFLIPKSKAIHYSAANYKVFEDQKKEFEAKNQESIKDANEVKKSINKKDIVIIENASDDGRLYGAVNNSAISVKINELVKGLEISKSDISLENPIKETGVYNVSVNLYSDIDAKLRLIVARNESEIKTVIAQAKAKNERDTNEEEDAKIAAKAAKDKEIKATTSDANKSSELEDVSVDSNKTTTTEASAAEAA